MDDKIKAFSKELDYIINPKLKEYATKAIANLPDYFFSIPASSSGKYHARFALGEGGLVRHVRAAVRIAVELYRMEMFEYFTEYEKDMILVALLLHDGTKSGYPQENHTVMNHPLVVVYYLRSIADLRDILPPEDEEFIFGLIMSHMGAWNKDRANNEILPKPKTKHQGFIHLVDYLASRRMIEMNFDVEVSR